MSRCVLVLVVGAAVARAGELDVARQQSAAGEWKQAEAHYRAALKEQDSAAVRRELAATLYNQALLLGRANQFAGTVALLREALELAPDLLDARIALVLSHDKLGQKVDAAAQLANIGGVYLQGGAPAKAQEAFAEAYKRDPKPAYLVAEGDALLQQRDFHGALGRFRKLTGPAADNAGLHRRMADAYLGLGLVKQALEELELACRLDAGPASSRAAAELYSAQGQHDAAIAKIREAEARGAKGDVGLSFLLANALYLKAVSLREAKASADAKPLLEQAVVAADGGLAADKRSELYQVKGLALLMLERYAEAAVALEAASRTSRGAAEIKVFEALAMAYQKLGQPAKAQEALGKARAASR